MQASLPKDLVPLGATTLLTIISTSCAIFLAIGEAVFQRNLAAYLSEVTTPDIVQDIISGGATNIGSVVNGADLPAIINAYSKAVTQVFVSTA